jgi:magnesium chelatase family protein
MPRPGELSLAHRGVLFLDELLEFRKQTLEVLRQPLENGAITIARAAHTLTYPARVMLIAATNPCPCGFLTDTRKPCTCSRAEIQRYRSRLSGPLLDRIDLHVDVPAVPYKDLRPAYGEGDGKAGKSSADMRASVEAARQRQRERFAPATVSRRSRCNADLSGRELEQHCRLDAGSHAFLGEAVKALHLSARAYTRILRVARTIADLADAPDITTAHLAEAVNCRALDRAL